ncbi:MAG: hypothetical protein ABIP51_11705 [Bacteroidia bacterium]
MKQKQIEGFKGFNFSLAEEKLYCAPLGKLLFFEVGKSASIKGKVKLCKNGIHFCKKLYQVFNYYTFDNSNPYRFFGSVISEGVCDISSEKICTSKLKIKEIIPNSTILKNTLKFELIESGKKRISINSKMFISKKIIKYTFIFNTPEAFLNYSLKKSKLFGLKNPRVTVNYEIYVKAYNSVVVIF